jgi:hypothetical protein
MNGEQYEAILKALADKLNDKDREIALKNYEIENLKNALKEAETTKQPILEIR